MNALLDTDTCIHLIRGKRPEMIERLRGCVPGDLGISAITLSELSYGVAKSTQPERNQQALEQFLLPLEIVPYDENAAAAYGMLRATLEGRGESIGAMDVLIAAHALGLGVKLITCNLREFSRVPGLVVEQW